MSTFFAHGYCFVGKLMAEMTGSKIVLVDECMDCSCTMKGLECCGIGHAGGVIGHPDDCKVLLDGCQALLVKTNNESLDCFSGSVINFTALHENKPHPDTLIVPKDVSNVPSVSETNMVPRTSTLQKVDKMAPSNDHVLARPLTEIFRDLAKQREQSKPLQPVIDSLLEANKISQPPLVPQEQTQTLQSIPFSPFWSHDFFLPWFFT
ncbi:hypothetical protein ACF0H5_022125 [Mactra antiquata]